MSPLLLLQRSAMEASMEGTAIALEGALDAREYIVGPGDRFSVSAGGLYALSQVVPVSADGRLALPESGSVEAAGRSLAEVRDQALAALRQRYRNVPLDVSLVQPRMFYVHLAGAVPEPGRYLMMPIARVNEALQQAYAARAYTRTDEDGNTRIVESVISERPDLNEEFRPSLRNVTLTRQDGTARSLDLMRYYTMSDMGHNPYLLDGDVIQVPSYHVERDAVTVSGEVPYAGSYDYRPGDTVRELLTIAAGPAGLSHLSEVRLTRRLPDGTVTHQVLEIAALTGGQDLPVQPRDHLNVSLYIQATARIQGMVVAPGTYPIVSGRTTLRELVAMAGGLTAEADLRAAFLERGRAQTFKTGGTVGDLDFFDLAYLQRSLGERRVVVDFEAALQPGTEEVVLYDGDRVVFPRDENTVYVTGNVAQPGWVEYEPGREARYYIDQAGGAGALTSGVILFEAGTGQVRTGERVEVRPGDTVFVNREDPAVSAETAGLLISDRASRRQARYLTTQSIISGVSALASITTALIAILSLR
jgi:protein involved in polysaccharide export with SLBB domain